LKGYVSSPTFELRAGSSSVSICHLVFNMPFGVQRSQILKQLHHQKYTHSIRNKL
jgi:hypothetical protein